MCPNFTPAQQASMRLRSRALLAANPPPPPIDAAAIAEALDPSSPFFITSSLFYECGCSPLRHHPASQLMCEDCGDLAEDCPDSRIADLRAAGIHILWDDPEIITTLDQHNTAFRRAVPA